jgi:hypothetical protein
MMQMLSTLLQISIAESSLLKQFSDGFSVWLCQMRTNIVQCSISMKRWLTG